MKKIWKLLLSFLSLTKWIAECLLSGGSPYSPVQFSSPLYKLEIQRQTKHGRFTRKGNSDFILDKSTTTDILGVLVVILKQELSTHTGSHKGLKSPPLKKL